MKPSQGSKFNARAATQATGTISRRGVLRAAGASAALAAFSPHLVGPANAQAAVKRIRFAHPAPTAHGWHIWAEQFKKTIEEKSGGKIQVQIFPNAQMGNERDTAQAVRLGSIEMGAIGVGLMNWVPEMSITDAPFLWKSRAQCWNAIAGAFGDDLRKRSLDKGFVLTGWTDLGFRTHDQQQAADQLGQGHAEPEDARAELEGVHRDDAGHGRDHRGGRSCASSTSRLRQGVADGQDTPPSVVKSNKYYEVQKYISKTDHILTTAYTVTNPKFYDGLSPDEKKLFWASCKDADSYLRQYTTKDESEAYEFLKAQGMQVNLTPDVESFRVGVRAGHREVSRPVPAGAREDRPRDAGVTDSHAMKIANAVKDAAASGRRIRGIHLTFAAPAVIEVLAIGRPATSSTSTASTAASTGATSRRLASRRNGTSSRRSRAFRTRRAATITRFLDRGVRGIVAPHIESLDDAQRVIDAHVLRADGAAIVRRGPPRIWPAHREQAGLHAGVQCGDFGLPDDRERAPASRSPASSRRCPGVDYLSFGMLDLAQSLGHPGDPAHADVKAAVADATQRIHAAGKRVREDFMNYVWINDVLLAGARKLLGAP